MENILIKQINKLIQKGKKLNQLPNNTQEFQSTYYNWVFNWENLVRAIYKRNYESRVKELEKKITDMDENSIIKLKIIFLKSLKSDIENQIIDSQDFSKKWRSYLLSTSLPLEYEAAKLLGSKEYVLRPNYNYNREQSWENRDSSVDILASHTQKTKDGFEYGINLLVECKYRHPFTKWLFVLDPNDPFWALRVWSGDLFRVINEFSYISFNSKSIKKFEQKVPNCYKGIEISPKKGEVYDKEMLHGIEQLQFALPNLYRKLVHDIFQQEYSFPELICPILLTTAELYIAPKDFSIEYVRNASKLEDLGSKVSYLVLNASYGRAFEIHCRNIFSPFWSESEVDIKQFEEDKLYDFNHRPSDIYKGFINGNDYYLTRYFTKFIVCNFKYFEKFLAMIPKLVEYE